jgi:hypothetical protein
MLEHSLIKHTEKFKNIRNINYIHGLIKYPRWYADFDLFRYLSPESLSLLQEKKAFFIFDASTEGFSPVTTHFPFFDLLYQNCDKYNIDPSMIIFVSSNLKDEENMRWYSKKKRVSPLNIFSFLSFEQVITIDENIADEDMIEFYEQARKFCNVEYSNKYFSSLSRVNRHYRTVATFLLCQSEIADKAFISHDKVELGTKLPIQEWIDQNNLNEFSGKEVFRWTKSLPLTVDRNDFKTNWALGVAYRHIHDRTLFQIVNETTVLDDNNTSLFYSEKTFRPVSYFQPFVIYGQRGCNHALKDIGYKTYEEWFDLSFDFEEDPVMRYRKLLASVTETCKMLDAMTRDQQIEWRFKNKELLLYNFNVMRKSQYSYNKLETFLDNLEQRYAANQ